MTETSNAPRTLIGCPSECRSAKIPDTVTEIDDYAFSGCTSLESAIIPDSVASLGHYAFKGCSSLTSVSLGGSVRIIRRRAFSGCSGLRSALLSVEHVSRGAFNKCTDVERSSN